MPSTDRVPFYELLKASSNPHYDSSPKWTLRANPTETVTLEFIRGKRTKADRRSRTVIEKTLASGQVVAVSFAYTAKIQLQLPDGSLTWTRPDRVVSRSVTS